TKEPTKEGYHFIQWDTTPTKVIADVVVTPVFAINVYHATYLDAQGKVFETVEVEHGADVVVPTKEPTKEGYHFIQWDTTPTNVTQNVTVCPVFEINVYQVTYLDAYGNVFKKLFLKHGEAPVEPTETPTKIGSHFVKWEFLPTKVTEDIRLTPVFAVNQYTVCFLDEKGNVLETQTINYGEKASVPKVVPEKRGYHFLRWNRRFTTITKDLIVEPVFERNQYQVTFLDGQTQVFEIQTVKYGQDADIPTKEPQKIGYHFVAWDCNIMNITKNLTVTPIFEKNVYEVTYVDGDGDVFQKEIVEHGANAIVPKDHPIKEGYHFTDWDKLPTEVVADQTVRPNFIINVYEVTYIDGEGRVFQTVEVEHGADVVVPSDHPIKKGYHFVKWEETPSAVTSDKTVGPVFEKDQQTVESSHTTSDYHIIKTGDASSLFLYIFLGIIAIVVVCVVIKRK
ncbi:MAG: InlB B-repeat-containing protein, partial [Lachnospiraceae bacterium]